MVASGTERFFSAVLRSVRAKDLFRALTQADLGKSWAKK
jgi:hypothetical protein